MIRNLLFLILCFFVLSSFAQDSKFSVELSYPIAVDNNFIGDNYNGIIDAGLKFRFAELNIVTIGASLNASYFKNSKSKIAQSINVNLYAIQPRVFAELNLENIPKLHPSLGLGYSIFLFKAEPNTTLVGNETLDQSGLNLNLGLAYDISDRVLIQVQYDFVKVSVDNNVPDITYNTNINILKIGLGYRF